MADQHHSIEVVVAAVQEQADGIKTWEFRLENGGSLPPFTSGAHIDISLANGLSRSYSLCNSQDDNDRYVVGIARDPQGRGGSAFIHDNLKLGDRLMISAPRNNFPLAEDAEHTVLIAGGIGITPMFSMVQRLEDLGRSWELWYSCRRRELCAFRAELDALEALQPGRVRFNFDQEPGGKMIDLKAVIATAPPRTHFYCCGPKPMLLAFEDAAAGLGITPAFVHVEYFTAKEEAATVGGLVVECRKSGIEITVQEGSTILDAMLSAGVDIQYSCLEGVCGSCECRVIEGIPDHRDSVLSPDEHSSNRSIIVCCSGAKSPRLVLDA